MDNGVHLMLEELARKYALQNALLHDGKADSGAVIGKVIAVLVQNFFKRPYGGSKKRGGHNLDSMIEQKKSAFRRSQSTSYFAVAAGSPIKQRGGV